MDKKLDQILLGGGGGGSALEFISDDPQSSARGIDAEWTYVGLGGTFTLPHEPLFIYSLFRNGVELESGQYSQVGTTLNVFPALGTMTGGEPESLTIKYKYEH